jgi:hypothetical protein
MRKATAEQLDYDEALKRYRQHLARARAIVEEHAQRAMSEARGQVKRAAVILGERMKAHAPLKVELEAMTRLEKYVWPPMDWPSPPWENPKRRKRKSRKSHAQKN